MREMGERSVCERERACVRESESVCERDTVQGRVRIARRHMHGGAVVQQQLHDPVPPLLAALRLGLPFGFGFGFGFGLGFGFGIG